MMTNEELEEYILLVATQRKAEIDAIGKKLEDFKQVTSIKLNNMIGIIQHERNERRESLGRFEKPALQGVDTSCDHSQPFRIEGGCADCRGFILSAKVKRNKNDAVTVFVRFV